MTRTYQENLRIATENENRDLHALECKCKAAARWLGRDESEWQSLIGLIIEIDVGRLISLETRPWTQEEIDSWRNYMMNR